MIDVTIFLACGLQTSVVCNEITFMQTDEFDDAGDFLPLKKFDLVEAVSIDEESGQEYPVGSFYGVAGFQFNGTIGVQGGMSWSVTEHRNTTKIAVYNTVIRMCSPARTRQSMSNPLIADESLEHRVYGPKREEQHAG